MWNDLEIPKDSVLVDDEQVNDFWKNLFEMEEPPKSYAQVIEKTYSKIEDALAPFLSRNSKLVRIDRKLEAQKAAQATLLAIEQNPKAIILNPVFIYEDAISRPTSYDARTRKISDLKMSPSTKKSDYIRAYWNVNIAQKSIKVKQYSIFILATTKYEKGEIKFYETFKANKTKTTPQKRGEVLLEGKQALKAGEAYNSKSLPMNPKTIFDIVSDDISFAKLENAKKPHVISFNKYLDLINKAKKCQNYSSINSQDSTGWGDNPFLQNLFPLALQGFNGNVVSKKNVINNIPIASKVFSEIKKGQTIVNKDYLKTFLKKLKGQKIVWYDFEGFALPYAALDNYQPYQQVPFQVSIIETIDDKITYSKDLVFDPKNFSVKDFEVIINTIFRDASHYIVYNKGYENTRLKEMLAVIKNDESAQKITQIIDKTIDIWDLFRVSSKKKLPPIFLPELKGMSSIKLVEKYITKKEISLQHMIIPYATLVIQNGMMAMEAGIKRAVGITGDKEWEQYIENLKKYCHNDVLAMIMVYDFAKSFIK